jgi:hypothetical protein
VRLDVSCLMMENRLPGKHDLLSGKRINQE